MKELDLIRLIRERARSVPFVATGIGDDAAVLDLGAGPVVVTTDLLVAGTHFRDDDPPEAVGRKSIAVSVSDVAAMGCRARAAFLAVALPRAIPDEYVEALLAGAVAAADELDVALAGGDTTETAGPATLCGTALGIPPAGGAPVLRSGARPGQALLVTGRLGGSLAGRHLTFVPRQREALALVERFPVGAMIDLSDGLSTDARHLARESGVTLMLHADRIPVSAAAEAAGGPRSPLERALHDGEDFELLFTVDADAAGALVAEGLAGTRVARIGEVVAGPPSVLLVRPDGGAAELEPGGFEHFGGRT